ncbi:ribonuclease H-like domain-containing protein [Hellea balneolensis]|uniref:ribonuclease H-like domain-containing protein n=1 Tax=Hellea balneolensis TaxID=287478 RepID=UPI00041A8B1A|nr:ribonuclease H-like domain-containing protein [Hellea balneolensis]
MGSKLKPIKPTRTIKPIPKKLYGELSLCCEYPEKVLFLDIETTGLSHFYDEITVVGWSIGGKSQTFVKGDDVTELLDAARHSVAMVTYNGIRFDQRFLKQEHPSIELPDVHIDLMYLCRRVNLTGGQKAIEIELGIDFREEIGDVDGFAAVLLWHEYLRGNMSSLNRLIQYNRADIAAMGSIFDIALQRLGFVHDLFGKKVKFQDWSAPKNMNSLPTNLKSASNELTRAPTFRELFDGLPAAKSKIVGIDLTGSETRPTGWCALKGSHVETKMIATDADIIAQTVAAKPDVISIDSPLCLPAGRQTVFDDDPTRDEFGIMRQCERELKRRGINVYPSLLPSMQKLTARGIRLAKGFRELGIPVIESYPGAAQDIMRIPRKGAGEKWLKLGLGEFGVQGDFLRKKVTHDELDAITSALVGTFHLAGLSEELGTQEEPPLIIPDLKVSKRPTVIGISGPIAAGKTTIAQVLEDEGYAYTRFSIIIDEILSKRNLKADRKNRQKIGLEINETGRQRELAERTIARVSGFNKIVVDGLRFPDDHAFLVEKFGFNFHHIFVDAQKSTRKKRYIERLKLKTQSANAEFERASSSEVEAKVDKMQKLAHENYFNNVPKYDIAGDIITIMNKFQGET